MNKNTDCLYPSPVTRHKILPLPLESLRIILTIWHVVHLIFEAGVGKHAMDHRTRITVANLVGFSHPSWDIVSWLFAIVLQCKATPWNVSMRRLINRLVHLPVILEWGGRWRIN